MPSPISPNVVDDFTVTLSPSMRRTLSSKSSKLQMEIEPHPEPIINAEPSSTPIFQSPTPLSQEAIRVELVALIKNKDEPRQSTPLDRYWNEDRQRCMFRAEPTLEPTVPRPTESAYEQKVVVTRPTMPTDAITTSPSLPIEPKSSPIPQPADTSSPPSMSKMLTWNLPTWNWFGTASITIQRKFQVPKQPPSPPCPSTPPSLPSRGPSPQPPQNPNPVQGNEESLQGKEPFIFDGNQLKTDRFLHKLCLYQFVNITHPIVRLKLAFGTTCAIRVLVLAQGPSFLRLRWA